MNLWLSESALPVTPPVDGPDGGFRLTRAFSGRHPVHRRQELHAVGGLETVDQIRHAVKPGPGLRKVCEQRLRVLDGPGNELDVLVRRVAAIGVARQIVTLDFGQNVAQVLRVGTIPIAVVALPRAIIAASESRPPAATMDERLSTG